EGRPTADFMALFEEVAPDQLTLVPDRAGQLTSNPGWDFKTGADELPRVIPRLKRTGARIALFADPDPRTIVMARALGANRVELYTGPYAEAFKRGNPRSALRNLVQSAKAAAAAGLGLNAGHDLTVDNLPALVGLPGLAEVSIGHHLIVRALEVGLERSVLDYRKALGHKL